jgi:hypothetical protein
MLTQPAPLEVSRTQRHTVSKIAVGLTADNRLFVAGITSGKPSGQPAVLSTQIEPFGNNNWQPGYLQLSGPEGMNYLTDLVVAAGNNLSHVVGLSNDGNIYCAGSENAGQWTPGAGLGVNVYWMILGPRRVSTRHVPSTRPPAKLVAVTVNQRGPNSLGSDSSSETSA